jgi:catechol 2,3-dioxygenase-like lactoylglutathione lyase family enzyme
MLMQITHANLWVRDQDEALAFYTEKVGLELRDDVTVPEMGGYRWLTVGAPGQPDLAFILNVPGPPVMDDDTARQLSALVAKGVASGFHLTTGDCRATYEELRGRGVEFHEEPTERPYGIDAAFRDPDGHVFRVVQPRRPAA